jgi:excinuclease ABC subunit C
MPECIGGAGQKACLSGAGFMVMTNNESGTRSRDKREDFSLPDKLKRVPNKPGVYLLENRHGVVLYAGKAKALRNRLRSHFKPGKGEDTRHKSLMSQIKDFQVIVTDSEIEALILEANLIKEKRPKYNVNLKDDKSYPYIRVTAEYIPRLFITRKIVKDGSRYFGPYTEVQALRQLMAAIRRIFPIRTCRQKITPESISEKKHRVCLNYHIGRCGGPCEAFITREEYLKIIGQVTEFIQGKNRKLVKTLQERMSAFSRDKRFEEAARTRDEIKAIHQFLARQKVVDSRFNDRDLIALEKIERYACAVVFIVREGKLINRLYFHPTLGSVISGSDVMDAFLKQYYLRAQDIPPEILISLPLYDKETIQAWLAKKRGGRVAIQVPQKGEKARLMEMCRRNASLILQEVLAQREKRRAPVSASVLTLQKDLSLSKVPWRIEAFDISNIQGKQAVAGLVVFENGKPKKDEYRRYRIKEVKGIDDYAMMGEVVRRRLSRLIKEKKELPDLILVDGGKGQLSAACKVLNELNISGQPVLGLAKKLEEVFLPGIPYPQNITRSSPGLYLLQRLRDEAHRFAVTYHRKRRGKQLTRSALDDIPGVGTARKQALLSAFGSVEAIRKASTEQIAAVRGMNRSVAENVSRALTEEAQETERAL